MRIRGINTECRMMRAISSHQDLRGSKMRFLVVSAFLACAAAAPSHLLAPVAVPVAGVAAVPVAYSAIVPTLSPGDLQAAVIDAHVKVHDNTIAAIDKARELNENAHEDLKEKLVKNTDIIKESTEEVFWAAQDKQWQALDALKTAEAQLDGALARNAPVLANSVVVTPYIPGVAPVAPIVYTPGVVAPVVKSIEPVKVEAAKIEEANVEEAKTEEKNEVLVKTAEEKKEEKESVTVEAATRNLDAKPQLAPAIAPWAIQPYSIVANPIVGPVGPVALSSVLKYDAWPHVGLAPTIVKTVW